MTDTEPHLERPRLTMAERLAAAPWDEMVIALVITAIVTGLCLSVFEFTGYWSVALFYLLTVVLAATRLSRWPTILMAATSALLWDFLFIPPRFTFWITHFQDLLMFGAYFVIAIVIGNLTSQLRERELIERRREERATALYRLTRALAASRNLDDALRAALPIMAQLFQCEVGIWLCEGDNLVLHPATTRSSFAGEQHTAALAFASKQATGRSTNIVPEAEALYLPLLAGERADGVLGIWLDRSPVQEQRELLDAFAAQLAVFVNKEHALKQAREAHLATESQKLQKTLFDSVSHELKTPLAAISATLEQPQPNHAELNQAVRRLTRTVEHLLDATRLESGALRIAPEWCEPGELLREAVEVARLRHREVRLVIAPTLPEILVDVRLLEQALVSLLTNADCYSSNDLAIDASVERVATEIVFSIQDRGSGLTPGEEKKVFEKFYRGVGKPAGGLGLGLSIARQLVEAHGGRIDAQNREGGGAVFRIHIPLGEPMTLPQDAPA